MRIYNGTITFLEQKGILLIDKENPEKKWYGILHFEINNLIMTKIAHDCNKCSPDDGYLTFNGDFTKKKGFSRRITDSLVSRPSTREPNFFFHFFENLKFFF